MIIDVNKINQQEVILRENIEPNKLDLAAPLFEFHDPVRVQATVSRITNTITVEFILSTVIQATCSRCLENYPIDFKKEFRLNFIADESGPLIDLNPTIAEEIILDFPIKPLCKTDCKGLCTKCGKDLNQTKCNCN